MRVMKVFNKCDRESKR